jgi:hypothetical protein
MATKDDQGIAIKNKILGQAKESLELRSKDREFHGLEKEFHYHQAEMIVKYEKTKDLKHPRDTGNARENILKEFLIKSGLLPKKYSISKTSVRVASTHGFLSKEIDILLFDSNEAITLMDRNEAYATYPIECCYGIIEVKSKLTKRELKKAFSTIASFKTLVKSDSQQFNIGQFTIHHALKERGFGIIFAYDTDLNWQDLNKELKKLLAETDQKRLPNAIFILNKGFFMWGDKSMGSCYNEDIENKKDLQVYPRPDMVNDCFYAFYSILTALLKRSNISAVSVDSYYRLPLTSGSISYKFVYEFWFDIGKCEKHGSYSRKISEENLKKLLSYSQSNTSMSYSEFATYIWGDNVNNKKLSEEKIWIYNPERLSIPDIIWYWRESKESKIKMRVIGIDDIICENVRIIIPAYYSVKENIINTCPKCPKYQEMK